MKQYLLLLLISGSLFLTSCETIKEISINQDNAGTITTTSDMSGLIGMAKMSGQGKELDEIKDKSIDTVISLGTLVDSLKDISAEEKAILKNGKLAMKINMADEKCVFKIELPFKDPAQIEKMDKLSTKLMMMSLKKMMANSGDANPLADMGGGAPEGSIDDYFTTNYSKGLIEKKLNKEKYAKVGDDEEMKNLKQMSSMGIGNSTIVINLPRPAIKAEGKKVKLSDDKKKITINTGLEDFFDDAASMEFRIEY